MIQLRPMTFRLLLLLIGSLVLFVTAEYAFPEAMNKSALLDFDVFHLVGVMISEGNLESAYDATTFHARQQTMRGYGGGILFWGYPPPFNTVVAILGKLPIWLAYVLFMGATFGGYLWLLRRINPAALTTTLVLMLPLFLLIIRTGQNSFLTGGLIGLTALLWLNRKATAGIPLGLMIIKPHLALGVGFGVLIDRRWSTAVIAIATLTAFCALATLIFSPAAWGWFLGGVDSSGQALKDGEMPLFRMTSVFAFGLTLGLSQKAAMIVHGVSALIAVSLLVRLHLRGTELRIFVGAAIFVSALISPYNYDYDLAMQGFAAALLLDVVAQQATRGEKWALFTLTWSVACYGLILSFAEDLGQANSPISPSAVALLCIGALLWRVIGRTGPVAVQGMHSEA